MPITLATPPTPPAPHTTFAATSHPRMVEEAFRLHMCGFEDSKTAADAVRICDAMQECAQNSDEAGLWHGDGLSDALQALLVNEGLGVWEPYSGLTDGELLDSILQLAERLWSAHLDIASDAGSGHVH